VFGFGDITAGAAKIDKLLFFVFFSLCRPVVLRLTATLTRRNAFLRALLR
jgi:uncharacterized membrane protein YtjA (UPF0391 family)